MQISAGLAAPCTSTPAHPDVISLHWTQESVALVSTVNFGNHKRCKALHFRRFFCKGWWLVQIQIQSSSDTETLSELCSTHLPLCLSEYNVTHKTYNSAFNKHLLLSVYLTSTSSMNTITILFLNSNSWTSLFWYRCNLHHNVHCNLCSINTQLSLSKNNLNS